MNSVRALCRVSRLSAPGIRSFASEQKPQQAIDPNLYRVKDNQLPEGLHPNFYRLKENQKIYQKPDGVPIHLKRGMRDKVLLYTTAGLLVIGLGFCAEFVYSLP